MVKVRNLESAAKSGKVSAIGNIVGPPEDCASNNLCSVVPSRLMQKEFDDLSWHLSERLVSARSHAYRLRF